MNLGLMAAILLVVLFLLLFSGLEIFLAFGITASVGLFFFVHEAQNQFGWTSWATLNTFTLTAVPAFVFMGEMFANTGVIRYLFEGANRWVGGIPGGLGISVIAANALFGAMSGSSVAAAATFGRIAFPEMQKQGYDNTLALGILAISGTLSVLIPPSIILIVYGSWENESVARLFAGTLIPGILLSIMLVLTLMIITLARPTLAPKPPASTWSEKWKGTLNLLPWLLTIVIILGVIFGGLMTPTEAAALGALLSVILAALYRKLTYTVIRDSFLGTIKVTAMIGMILAMAQTLAYVTSNTGISTAITQFTLGLPFGKWGILIAIYILYLILGCFFDSLSMLVLTIPFIAPVITNLGFSILWFGVTYVVLAEIGLVTPPFGLNLFVLSAVTKFDIITIAKGSLPFLIPALVLIALLTVFPQLISWLPTVLYSR